jgi:ubiquitin carboxyl-terminal hydrolase 36/42
MSTVNSRTTELLLLLLTVQVRAYKRISIENAPNVLTVHLKRFDFFGRGHKVSKRVDFDMQLDLGPFMTSHLQRRHHHKHHHHHHHHHGQQHHGHHQPVLYDLYAVLVHHGHSLHSGHYVSFVKAGNGIWHHCDDHRVAQISERMVEGQQAYILFYVRRQPKGAKLAAAAGTQAAVAAANAVNREQQRQLQREQLRQQKQQDSSKSACACAGVSAAAGEHEAGSVSAAEALKVVTSSTESTANASPAEGDGQPQ